MLMKMLRWLNWMKQLGVIHEDEVDLLNMVQDQVFNDIRVYFIELDESLIISYRKF